MTTNLSIIQVDYSNSRQAGDLVHLLNTYATDPMGVGKPLEDFVTKNLVTELHKRPHAFSVISYVNNQPAGLINCFEAFSTFSCKPLINIHDVIVLKEFRGMSLSQMMLSKVEEIATSKGCCKLTLEVLSKNDIAKSSYKKFGFDSYELDPSAGNAMFWQKIISSG